MISPLFSPEEAARLIRWLDTVGSEDVSYVLIGRLKELVGLWSIDPEPVIV